MHVEGTIYEPVSREIICRFLVNRMHPREGYYRMETADGEFLGNVDEGDLNGELSALREEGYWIGSTAGRR